MAQKAMNRWQKVYCDMYYDGKAPRDAQGKRDVKMLGAIKSKVKVEFPDFKGVNGIIPAHTEVFEVTENESNMPKGKYQWKYWSATLISGSPEGIRFIQSRGE